MFVIQTTLSLVSGERERALELVDNLVEHSRQEDGTVRYQATESLTEPGTLHFFEQYEDRTAAEQHTESSVYEEFAGALPELADGELETIQFETDKVEVFEYDAAEAAK
ncbi:putative quinol monooxygenase [Halovenus halobia]|uniref:putative quinol monooxygenase n=1 Tax=Halovenus halobia TaxID=3396622 RepID=UPI003F559421